MGLLSGPGAVVPRGLEFHERELGILELDLLEADDLRGFRRQPIEQMGQTYLERINVP